jgi:glycosyltransferase involved in cell wall biosynthesis
MKVVQLTSVPLSLRFLSGHIRFLRQQGADVVVVTSPSPQLDAFAEAHDVPAFGIEMTRRISPVRDLISLMRLVELLREIRPDIVHAHTPKAGLIGMLAAALAHVPIRLYHIHGLPLLTARGPKRLLLKTCDAIACGLAHRVYCVSHSIMRAVVDERISSAAKLSVLAGGTIDGIEAQTRFNPARIEPADAAALRCSLGIPNGAKVIGFVGRVVEDKGIYELLAAFEELKCRFADLHLLVIGPSEGEAPISSAARRSLENEPRIHRIGFVDDPAIYYALMDVVALPTYREGFGLVAAEAAAMERPVVATRIPGCIDAVRDGVTATLVPPRDAPALAAALAKYLGDPELCRSHGQVGRQRVLRDFQPIKLRTALWHQYLQLMLATRRPHDAQVPDWPNAASTALTFTSGDPPRVNAVRLAKPLA